MEEKDKDKKLNNSKPNTSNSASLFNTILNKGGQNTSQNTTQNTQKPPITPTQPSSIFNLNKPTSPFQKPTQTTTTPSGSGLFSNLQQKQQPTTEVPKSGTIGGISFDKQGYAGAKHQPQLTPEERQALLRKLNNDLQKSKEIKEMQQDKASSIGGLFSSTVNKYGKNDITIEDILKSVPKKPQTVQTQEQPTTIEQPAFGQKLATTPVKTSVTDPTGIERPYAEANKAKNIDGLPKPSVQPAPDLISQLKALRGQNTAQTDQTIELDERDRNIIEQLRQLQRKQDEDEDEKKKKRKGFFWILFIALLIGVTIATGILVFFSREWGGSDYEYVRISISMKNAMDVFYETTQTGEKIPRLINPGDSFDLIIVARNSNNIEGDDGAANWYDIFVRFAIWLEIDGNRYPHFVKINPDSDLWHTYNAEEESKYINHLNQPIVPINDGYYYLKKALKANESVELIRKITFDAHNITEMVGGMVAKLVVQIEVIDSFQAILDRTYWRYAPEAWMQYMSNLLNNNLTSGNTQS